MIKEQSGMEWLRHDHERGDEDHGDQALGDGQGVK